MQEKTLDAILAMLTGLGIPHGTDPDILLRTYAIAVHGIRQDSIVEVCGRYIRGDVDGHKKGRAPTTDLFTNECRSWASAMIARENRPTASLPKPEERIEMTQEEREAMRDKLNTLNKALKGDRASQEALQQYGWRE
jgi:hypothetical protein